MAIEAVLFDIGGVLLQPAPPGPFETWAAAHGLAGDVVWARHIEAIGSGWEGGRTLADIHADLIRLCGIDGGELPGLLDALASRSMVDERMATFARRLRGRYRTGIVSNHGEGARQSVCERFGLHELVDVIVISSEERVNKPDPRMFRAAAERLGVTPEQCLFVDDTPMCVDGARALGMTAIRFESVDQALHDMRRALDMVEHDYDAAGAVVVDGDRVLVLDRPSRDEVRLPKGHVEPDETDAEAAVREVGEEAGYIDVEIEADLGTERNEFDVFPPEGPGHHMVRREHYFRMRLHSDRQAERSESDHKFVPRWIPRDDVVDAVTWDNEREWVRRALS